MAGERYNARAHGLPAVYVLVRIDVARKASHEGAKDLQLPRHLVPGMRLQTRIIDLLHAPVAFQEACHCERVDL